MATTVGETAPFDTDGGDLVPAVLEGHAVQIYDRILDPLAFVEQFGQAMFKSGMFGCASENQGKVLAWACLTERKSPIEITRTFHIIDGNLTMKADAMLARFQDLGGDYEILERTPDKVAIRLTRGATRNRKSRDFSLTWDEIKNEPFTKAKDGKVAYNYSTPIKRMQMMWARLTSDSVRAFDARVSASIYTPEEFNETLFDTGLPSSASPEAQQRARQECERDVPVEHSAPKEPTTPAAPADSAEGTVAAEAAKADEVVTHSTATPIAKEKRIAKCDKDWLRLIAGLKKELGDDDMYQRALKKFFNVDSAYDINNEQAAKFVPWLKNKISDKQLENWADGAAKPKDPAPGK